MINDADVPARAIEKVAFQKSVAEPATREKYYVLDDEYELLEVLDISGDEEKMQSVFRQVMKDIGPSSGFL